MEQEPRPKPWYRRKVSRRDQLIMAFVWIPGVVLAILTDNLVLRVIGLGLMLVGLVLQVTAMVRSEDA